ncbi:MAG: hypothetical protein MJ153_02040 [Clostridia bacterium]|nr:hypothetical protein [Clostridia bacterium]
MKLYYKSEFLSLNPKQSDINVTDSENNVQYIISGNKAAFGRKVRIMNVSGSEAALIEQKFSLFVLKFKIKVGEKEFTFRLKHQANGALYFKTDDNNWSSTGNLRDASYTIVSQTGSEFTVNKLNTNDNGATDTSLIGKIENAYNKMTTAVVREISGNADTYSSEVLALAIASDMAAAADNNVSY